MASEVSKKTTSKEAIIASLLVSYGDLWYNRFMSNRAIYTPVISKMPRHGLTGTPEYWAWHAIKQRCYNPNHQWYVNYGGRGVKMYEPWLMSFMEFYKYVGKRPGKGYSIDRIDNTMDYEPGNVKWSTKIEQDNNRRSNKPIEYNGKITTAAIIARENGVNAHSLRYYYKKYGNIYTALKYAQKIN